MSTSARVVISAAAAAGFFAGFAACKLHGKIAAIKLLPDGRTITLGPQRIDPGMPISAESQRVTGIADADVAGVAPRWEEVAAQWREFLEGCVLHGYNARRFDVPVLRAEFERAGIRNFPPVGIPVVDSQRIHFAKEQRTLTAALAHYCGKVLEGAHGALADTRAALDVLRAQVARYPDLPRTPEGLSGWCSAGRNGDATWDGKFRWSGDSIVFGWGRLQGQPLSAAAVEERDHLMWLKEQDLSDETLLLVMDALAGVVHDRASLAARFAGAADALPAPAE